QKVDFFWGDERSVAPTHGDSNYRMAHDALLRKLSLRAAQIHRMEAERSDGDSAAREYERMLADSFATTPNDVPPSLDLILLGMGPDGHTASLFPHTTALKEKNRWVVINYVAKFSSNRMTMTYPAINAARQVLFLIAGPDKADALHEVLEGLPNSELYPSQGIKPRADGPLFYVDRAAAAKLAGKE
ncbi:MAG: 6-phosphogluconolactonase, partial [Candidatus Acidiferrum sp.]